MNNFSKSLLAVAILAASTGAANASIQSLAAGANEAFLQVYDHGMTYDLDLGPAATSDLLKAAVANALTLDYRAFMSADANWAAFTSVANGFNAATAKYGVFVGNGVTAEFTTTNALSVKPAASGISAISDAIALQANNINAGSAIDAAVNSSKLVSDLDAIKNGQWAAGSAGINLASTIFGSYSLANAGIVYGTLGNFYSETRTGATATTAALLGHFALTGAGLTFAAGNLAQPEVPSSVPVPAAVWMFGAGLMGVLRLNRRKSAAV